MKKLLITSIILLIIVVLAVIVMYLYNINTLDDAQQSTINSVVEPVIEEKEVQIFNGDSRPIAVMIDNVGDARPQAGLNDAYIVYEIIVEGNLTRLMALFKDVELEKIGPIRS